MHSLNLFHHNKVSSDDNNSTNIIVVYLSVGCTSSPSRGSAACVVCRTAPIAGPVPKIVIIILLIIYIIQLLTYSSQFFIGICLYAIYNCYVIFILYLISHTPHVLLVWHLPFPVFSRS